MQLTERQKIIAQFIKDKGTAGNHEIQTFLVQKGESLSRITLIRDLAALLEAGEIRSIGKGRSVKYEHSSLHPLLHDIDAKKYLDDIEGMRMRDIIRFNHDLFEKMSDRKCRPRGAWRLPNIFPQH